jgi:hypothetical protein
MQPSCPYHCRRLAFPWVFHRWTQLAIRPHPEQRLAVRRSDRPSRRSDRPRNTDWWSDRHPRRLDRPALHSSCVACAVFGHAPHSANDSTCATRGPGVHDSGRTSRGIDVPALPTTLLASPSSYAGAIGTASTLVVTVGEVCIGGTSDQPSSDDHAGEAGLPGIGRQTHPVGHLDVDYRSE